MREPRKPFCSGKGEELVRGERCWSTKGERRKKGNLCVMEGERKKEKN